MSENEFEHGVGSSDGSDPNTTLELELEAEGWQRAGEMEFTHTTPLNPDTGRFEPKAFRTPEDIEKMYLERFRSHGFTEAKAVRRRVLKEKLGWFEDPYSYYVYLRKSGD